MSDNDTRITAIEARLVTLESTVCACPDCQAARRHRNMTTAILKQLAIQRAPDAIAQIRNMSLRDQSVFWKAASDERAIELLIGPDVTDDERDAWGGMKLAIRDRVELELVELPDRVRVRLAAENLNYTASSILIDDNTAKKLQSAGLGARLVRKHPNVTELVPLQIARGFPPPVIERRQLEEMLKIDTRLHDCISAGEMVVEQLSELENKLIEAQMWRDLDWHSRPKRPRKKRDAVH
jgi:hypothetical protein